MNCCDYVMLNWRYVDLQCSRWALSHLMISQWNSPKQWWTSWERPWQSFRVDFMIECFFLSGFTDLQTQALTSFMLSSGRSCSIMACSCLRCMFDFLSSSFTGVAGEGELSSSLSSLSPSSSRWTAPLMMAKLSLINGKMTVSITLLWSTNRESFELIKNGWQTLRLPFLKSPFVF